MVCFHAQWIQGKENIRVCVRMICAENIYDKIIAAIDLIPVISSIWYSVGGLTTAFYVNAILIFLQRCGSEPCGTIFFIDEIFFSQFIKESVNLAIFIKSFFICELIKMNAKGS